MENSTDIFLRDFSKEHIDKTFAWVCDEELQKFFLIKKKPTAKSHSEYFKKVLNDKSQRWFAIYSGNNHVGNCGIKNISFENKIAELWIYIGEKKLWGKGIGFSASKLLISFAFNEYKLLALYLHVADFNGNAIKMYKRLGFKTYESILPEDEWKNRKYNIITMRLKKE